jgi:hypothetical protein
MEKYQILPESLHSRALQHSINNLDRELAGQSTDDPECIDGKWLSLPLLSLRALELRILAPWRSTSAEFYQNSIQIDIML